MEEAMAENQRLVSAGWYIHIIECVKRDRPPCHHPSVYLKDTYVWYSEMWFSGDLAALG